MGEVKEVAEEVAIRIDLAAFPALQVVREAATGRIAGEEMRVAEAKGEEGIQTTEEAETIQPSPTMAMDMAKGILCPKIRHKKAMRTPCSLAMPHHTIRPARILLNHTHRRHHPHTINQVLSTPPINMQVRNGS